MHATWHDASLESANLWELPASRCRELLSGTESKNAALG